MTLYDRRHIFRKLSLAAGRLFSKVPLSPNEWTLLALAIALSGFFAIFFGFILMGALIFVVASFVDIIDGAVARVTKRANNFGAYLDTIIDKYIEFVAICSLLLLSLPTFLLPSYTWILLLAFGCLMTSFAKSSSAEKNVVPHREGHGASGSILDHTDRQLLVIFAILLAAFSLQQISAYLVALTAVLANISVIQRVANARKVWLGSMR